MEIKILSSGCANCKRLQINLAEVLENMGLKAIITIVENPEDILKFGVSVTPALVINEKISSIGRVLTQDEIKELLEKEIA